MKCLPGDNNKSFEYNAVDIQRSAKIRPIDTCRITETYRAIMNFQLHLRSGPELTIDMIDTAQPKI